MKHMSGSNLFSMRVYLYSLLGLFADLSSGFAQVWSLQLSSNVELRTSKLSSKVERSETGLGGANIALYQGSTLIKTVKSTTTGDFVIDVPANGEFVLIVSYGDCNAKKFSVNTMGVPQDIGTNNFKPKFGIGGFLMAKPLPGIDYSILAQPLVKVKWIADKRKFDHDESYTDKILDGLGRVAEAENALIQKFVEANKAGDEALKKNNCPLAKTNYENALSLISTEQYPKEQLTKVGLCLKDKDTEAKKAEEAAAARAAEEKQKADKLAAEKNARETAKKEKEEAERLAKEKATREKIEKEKAEKEKAEADHLAKEKARKDKEDADKLAKEKAAQEKLNLEKLNKEQQAQKDKEAAEKKTASDKLLAEKAAKEKKEAEERASAVPPQPKTKENSGSATAPTEKVSKHPDEKSKDNTIVPVKTEDPATKPKKQKKSTSRHSVRQKL